MSDEEQTPTPGVPGGSPPGMPDLPPGMMPPGMTPGVPPPPGGEGVQTPTTPSATESGTVSPQDSMTRYDEARDAYHCSYGIPQPALGVWDPERELIVRVDRNTFRVIGFSIPEFTAWHRKHADENGEFEVDLPDVWPRELTDMGDQSAQG